jgi:drug/metabolite transporter (DMT)-like permease
MARFSFPASGYARGMLYASGSAALLAIQNPFSSQAAKELPVHDFVGVSQFALLLSLPLLLWKRRARVDFFRAFRERNSAMKLAALFALGLLGLVLYNVGLREAHPMTVSAILNLSPFWAALVARLVAKKPIPVSAPFFFACLLVAFAGVLAIAWSQSDPGQSFSYQRFAKDVLHGRAAWALPVPALLALSATLMAKWFDKEDTMGVVAANFVVSAGLIVPGALLIAIRNGDLTIVASHPVPVALLVVGTLVSAALGRALYQIALRVTENDNGFVTLFFLLEPAFACFVSAPLSRYVASVHVQIDRVFLGGLALVVAPLFVFCLKLWKSEGAKPSVASKPDVDWVPSVPIAGE